MTTEERLDQFMENKGLVFGIAYRMTGSVTEAEDIVQETFLRWEKSAREVIRSPKAFLSTIATRLSLDSLRKEKKKRETYIGPWLPEPMAPSSSEEEPDSETLDLAFLHLLEKLNPLERAVFLLRETFGMEYPEISKSVGKSQENCRQILKRAKDALKKDRRRYTADPQTRRKIFKDFLLASTKGDPELLIPFLKQEIVVWSDGGGKVNAARIPILGKERVASFLNRVRSNRSRVDLDWYFAFVNGAESILGYYGEEPAYLQSFLIENEGIWRIMSVLNPEKLGVFRNRNQLLESGKIVPLEVYLLFPNSRNPSLQKWLNPIAKLVKWAIVR
ncbi:sigma-70 family RNA polymerase sigma factor [Leptospira wolffii]|uniref:Sigma-70 family RNA polymerase sigma factor n=1 Tax=Leptospira wolffii TaxID=409998 RepID=A0ABV5BQQ0_9LEPT